MDSADRSIQYGVIDFARLETEPGGRGPLAPPAGFSGDDSDYVALLRNRYRDPGGRQHLAMAARAIAPRPNAIKASITGTYENAARDVLQSILKKAQ